MAEHLVAGRRMQGTDEDLIDRVDRAKALIWTLLGLLYVAIGTLVIVAHPPSYLAQPFVQGLLLALVIIVFGSATIRGWLRLFSATPAVAINHSGICISVGSFKTMIGWQEIEGLTMYKSRIQEILEIKVADGRAVLAHQSRIPRLIGSVAQLRLLTSNKLVIGDAMLSTSFSRLLQETQQRYGHELRRNHIRVSLSSGPLRRRR